MFGMVIPLSSSCLYTSWILLQSKHDMHEQQNFVAICAIRKSSSLIARAWGLGH